MAIKLPHNATQIGVNFSDAYWRISAVNISFRAGHPEKHNVGITVSVYANAAAAAIEGTQHVAWMEYTAPLSDFNSPSGNDFIAECYSWLNAYTDLSDGKPV